MTSWDTHAPEGTGDGTAFEAAALGALRGRRLLVRAAAGPRLGMGHVTRCLALAQAWTDAGGAIALDAAGLPDVVVDRWRAEGATIVANGSGDADWLVLDGPPFPSDLAARRRAGTRVLIIDDAGARDTYPCDLLLNQTLGARPDLYAGRTDARLLTGPRYALLRRDLRSWRNWRRTVRSRAERLLVTFGGSDPFGHTERALEALDQMSAGIETAALIGPANPRAEALAGRIAAMPHVTALRGIADPGPAIRACDLALSAAGSTVWELALFGTPMLLGAAVPVEEGPATAMVECGAARSLGRLSDASPERIAAAIDALIGDVETRRRLSRRAHDLIDGQGVGRVLAAMAEFGAA